MIGHYGNGAINIGPQLTDLAGFVGQFVLPPVERHRLGNREQVDRPGQQDALFKGPAQQRQIMLHCGGKEVFAGDEHDDEIGGRAKLGPIGFFRQAAGVEAHGGSVALHRGQPVNIVAGLKRGQIIIQAALGIDDQLAIARQLDDGIGPLAATVTGHVGLQGEIDAGAQARHFQRVGQLLFAPTA